MDLKMPDLDGLEATRRLAQDPATVGDPGGRRHRQRAGRRRQTRA